MQPVLVRVGRSNHVSRKVRGPPPNHRRDSELINEFKAEMERGDLKGVLGVDSNLSAEQEQSLKRLEDKWMSGMQGHYNAASEDRKPLMISFDDDDNLVSTEVAALTMSPMDLTGDKRFASSTLAKEPNFMHTMNEVQLDGNVVATVKIRQDRLPMSSIVRHGWCTQI